MANDVVTNLVVFGVREWLTDLSAAATAHDRLITAISRKAPPIVIGEGLETASAAFIKASTTTEEFKGAMRLAGKEADELISKVSGNTKVIREYTAEVERAEKAQKQFNAALTAAGGSSLGARASSLNDTRFGSAFDRQQLLNQIDQQSFRQTVPGGHGNLTTGKQEQNTAALAANRRFVEQQIAQEEEANKKLIRGTEIREQRRAEIIQRGIEERGKRLEQDVRQSQEAATRLQQINAASVRAEEMLEKQREKVAQDAARRRSTALHSQQSQDKLNIERIRGGTDFFSQRTGVKSTQLTGFNNAPTANLNAITTATNNVTQASLKKNQALDSQSQAEKRTGAAGITYLSTLSAIHAASFLVSNQTFTMLGSLTTLGAAFSKLGLGASLLGVTFGGALLAINGIMSSIERLQQLAFGIVEVFTKIGAGIVAGLAAASTASVKLASDVESVFSEIVAFGEPGRISGNAEKDLQRLDSVVSNLSRTTGISAKDITSASSQYIRAGNDIEAAIDGGTAAVVRLQVASRGELIPTQSARVVSTLSNSFQELRGDADAAANIIIATGQKSALTMGEVAQAFQQAAPSAAQYNITAIDLAATLAVLANNGLRGQVAGTAFKQVMLDLINPSAKAQEQLNKYGISIKDANNNIRPLGDIINDLNVKLGDQARAFEKTGDASKAQAIAAIFGSRANLGASIIARTGTADFNKMREAIASVDSEQIVQTLLAPTAAQAAIASANVQELARSFGGPLNVAIGSAISKANEFVTAIDRKHFERAGQAIIAVGTAQGFGPIIESLGELEAESPKAASILTNLLNVALTVRNAFINEFIPAVQQAGSAIGESLGNVDVDRTFNAIATGILAVISAGSRLTVFVGELIASFINGDERGQSLRTTIIGLATGIATSLVGAFVVVAAPMAVTVKLLNAVGKATIDLLDDMQNFNNIFEASWQLAKNSVNNFLKDVAPGLQAFGQFLIELPLLLAGDIGAISRMQSAFKVLDEAVTGVGAPVNVGLAIRQFGNIDKAILKVSTDLRTTSDLIDALEEQRFLTSGIAGDNSDLDNRIRSLTNMENIQNSLLGQLQEFKRSGGVTQANLSPHQQGIKALRDQIDLIRRAPLELDDILNFQEGDLPQFFSNLTKQVQEFEDSVRNAFDHPPTEGAFTDDPAKAARTAKTIRDIEGDALLQLANMEEDLNTKREEREEQVSERLIEIATHFVARRKQIFEDAEERKAELDENLFISRGERAFTQSVQRQLQAADREHGAFLQRRDFREERSLAASERANQRKLQDNEKTLSLTEQAEERFFGIQQQLQERAFQRNQSVQDRALSLRQSNEEDALTKQLRNEATLRTEQQQLAKAKTPQERIDLQAQFNQSRQDTAFSDRQQKQLTDLRRKHEAERVKFSNSQEDAGFVFRLQLQVAEFNFKLTLERQYQRIRRQIEDQEFERVDRRDTVLLDRRIDRTEEAAQRQLQTDRVTQSAQDQLQDLQTRRQQQNIDRDAGRQVRNAAQSAAEQSFNVVAQAEIQRQRAENARERQVRQVQQRAVERGQTLTEELGHKPTGLEAALNRINIGLIQTGLLLIRDKELSDEFLNTFRDTQIENIQQRAPGVDLSQPQRGFVNPGTTAPLAQVAGTSALQLTMSPDFLRSLTAGVTAGVIQGNQQQRVGTTGLNQQVINGNIYGFDDWQRLVQQFLFSTAGQRRQ